MSAAEVSGGRTAGAPVPPAAPALLVADLDGTLLDAAGRPFAGVVEALIELDGAGVSLVVCSGRPHPRAAGIVAEACLPARIIVSSHGGLVTDPRRGVTLRHLVLSPRLLPGLLAVLRGHGLGISAYLGPSLVIEEPAALDALASAPPPGVTRLIAIGESAQSVAPAAAEAAAKGGRAVRVDRPLPTRLDVRHRLATKDEALRFVAAALHVPLERTIALGDDASDAAMLRLAGCGVMVGRPVVPGTGALPRAPLSGSPPAVPTVAPGDLPGFLRAVAEAAGRAGRNRAERHGN